MTISDACQFLQDYCHNNGIYAFKWSGYNDTWQAGALRNPHTESAQIVFTLGRESLQESLEELRGMEAEALEYMLNQYQQDVPRLPNTTRETAEFKVNGNLYHN